MTAVVPDALHRRLISHLRSDPLLRSAWEVMDLEEVWVAGGWVRDTALGRPSQDLDLVVRGEPREVASCSRRLAHLLGARAHLVGKPPKAVWRIDGRVKVEIWPLGLSSPQADAQRRDFTANAMLWRLPDGPLMDPTGGLEDCDRRVIRAVNRHNLTEDPIRLLRGVRLAAALSEFVLDPTTRHLISTLAPSLVTAPRERVGQELLTMARLPVPAPAFEDLVTLGLVAQCAPFGIDVPQEHGTHSGALRRLTGREQHPLPGALAAHRPVALLAWLVTRWGGPGTRLLTTFSWPQPLLRSVTSAARHLAQCIATVDGSARDRREVLAALGPDAAPALVVASAFDDTHEWRRWWRQWRRNQAFLEAPTDPLSTDEVAAITGLAPGPDLGRILAALRRAVVRDEIRSAGGARRWLLRSRQFSI